ncbi:MAG: peroxiredoxin [Bdellovibrionales bacterium]|nr:peroxiredoxin [Bdellovibrionales bacterium]
MAKKKKVKSATRKVTSKATKTGTKAKKTTTTKKVALTKRATATKKVALKSTQQKVKKSVQSPVGTEPAVSLGQVVPDFSLPVTGSKLFQLSAMKGKKIVLYFYPKDSTPGCTIEGHDFTKLHNEFKNKNVEVYGVSRDSISSHEKFKDKQCYSIDLISDPDEKICRTFGVIKIKNMYGKKVLGIERSTFVIDENGQLEKEWRGVKVEGHAQEVLDYIGSRNK